MSKKNQDKTNPKTEERKDNTTVEASSEKIPLFGKKNYQLMAIGVISIVVGYFLMIGPDANTNPDGIFDPNYWNEGIFSFQRIRVAPFLVIAGFVIEIYAILVNPHKNS